MLIGAASVERILRDPRVRAATLTGSTPAGRSIGSIAGEELKPVVLELGGSDPFVVMPSADIEKAAQTAVTARVQNNGQSCIAAKRFIVHEDVADAFGELFVARMDALRVGDPMDEQTEIGPLANEQGVLDVESYIADAVEQGARLLCGGERLDRRGVLLSADRGHRRHARHAHVPRGDLRAGRAAVPGRAVPTRRSRSANATVFGLGSNIWTRDAAEQERFVTELDAGAVFVNGMTTSYPELPFGGVKESGFGRELSAQGIRAFCNVKTVWVG